MIAVRLPGVMAHYELAMEIPGSTGVRGRAREGQKNARETEARGVSLAPPVPDADDVNSPLNAAEVTSTEPEKNDLNASTGDSPVVEDDGSREASSTAVKPGKSQRS